MTREWCHLLWAEAHLKWTEKWKTVVWSDKSLFEILFGNHVFWTKEGRDHSVCYLKPASLMVWGYIRPIELANCASGKATSVLEGMYRF